LWKAGDRLPRASQNVHFKGSGFAIVASANLDRKSIWQMCHAAF
jgi:hypothetical protein